MMNQNIFTRIEENTFLYKNKKFFLLISTFLVFLSIIMPDHIHDYRFYVAQWKTIKEGLDPYEGTSNAYGLVYNLFAYTDLSKTIPIPRVLFILTYLVASYSIWQRAINKKVKTVNLILLILLFNPLVWLYSTLYGSNDGFLSGITAIGILYLLNNKNYIAGFLLAIAVGFKFTPIVITPFLFLNIKSINYKASITFILTTISIYLTGYFRIGHSIFKPFIFGSVRESKVLSIFRFIRGEVQPLKFININNLDQYSTHLVLFSCLFCFALYVILKLEKTIIAFLCYSYVLLFYKVGNYQFYFLLLLMAIITLIQNEKILLKHTNIIKSFSLFFILFFALVCLYGITGGLGGKFIILREYISLPIFIVHLTANIILTKELIFSRSYSLIKN